MKVKALKGFESVVDTEVGRVRKADEVFEVTNERGKKLLEHNLVVEVKEEKKIETATLEPKKVEVPKAKEVKKNKKK